jgi:2'-5' RNA ligase
MMVEDQELLRVLEAAIITGNTEVVDRIIGLQHKYGSTQVQLPAAEAAGIFALAATIPEDDLYEPEGGRETDAHITVKYGLIDPDPNSVKDAIAGRGPVAFTLGQTGVFSHLDYDVVYVAVNSPDLGDLHTKIASGVLCAPSDYDTYRPHATVAYVKSGRGVKYSGMTALDGLGATINTLMVSDIDGNKTEIPLA